MSMLDQIRKRGKRLPPPKKKKLPAKKVVKAAKVNGVKRNVSIRVESDDIAKHHQRRVTLNLLRHSAVAPKKLVKAINRLAGLDWDFKAISKKDAEVIFGLVTDKIADTARDEFVADLETIADLKRDPRSSNPDNRCELCGHMHIRWEFDLRNIAGGKDTRTGSTCIRTYGLNVDGYGTAEAALKALTIAIAEAQRRADMQVWQEEHVDHVAEMAEIRDDVDWLMRHRRIAWRLYSHVQPAWQVRVAEVLKAARSVTKYYRQHNYLTELKSEQAYGSPGSTGVLQATRDMRAELIKAYKLADSAKVTPADRKKQDAIKGHRKFWSDLIDKFGAKMTWHEQRAAEHCKNIAKDPSNIYGRYATMLNPYIKAFGV